VSTVVLTDVQRFVIPAEVLDRTDEALREAGLHGAEMFVLWTGHVVDATFTAATAYVPEQVAHELADGLCVTVDGNALHELNRWLFEQQQTLAVQVHTHPTRAYHSSTDDAYPIVTQRGGLSLVVPDFGTAGVRGQGVALYRLGERSWKQQRRRPTRRLLLLEPSANHKRSGR
jgi:hypothetical protein